ncbi:MAG: hypothetical protein LH613_03770 [Chamaesiphon sp.]|nr:hypothetical protein [Chamaesiphon sp.]
MLKTTSNTTRPTLLATRSLLTHAIQDRSVIPFLLKNMTSDRIEDPQHVDRDLKWNT